jgi:hypothetical protein
MKISLHERFVRIPMDRLTKLQDEVARIGWTDPFYYVSAKQELLAVANEGVVAMPLEPAPVERASVNSSKAHRK